MPPSHFALPGSLAGDPLHHKSGTERKLSNERDDDPEVELLNERFIKIAADLLHIASPREALGADPSRSN